MSDLIVTGISFATSPPSPPPPPPFEEGDVHRVTLRLYDRIGSGLTVGDAATGYQLRDFLDSVGQLAGRVDDLVSDTDEGPGWSALLDIDRTPDVPFLGQFVGAQVHESHSDMQQRDSVRNVAGWSRGTPQAIVSAVQAHLTGGRTVNLIERNTSAYQVRVQTYGAETPDPAAAEAAARAAKPGGLILIYDLLTGQQWQNVFDDSADWDGVMTTYTDWQDVRDTIP